jgi:hypothetical protein
MKTKYTVPILVIFCLVVSVFEFAVADTIENLKQRELDSKRVDLSGIPKVWGIPDSTPAEFHEDVYVSSFPLKNVSCLNGKQFSGKDLDNCKSGVLTDKEIEKVALYLRNKNRFTFSSIEESNNRYKYLVRLYNENPNYFNKSSNLDWIYDPVFNSYENEMAKLEGRPLPHTPENFKKQFMSIADGIFFKDKPIVFDKNFVIVDGGHRMAILRFLEVFENQLKDMGIQLKKVRFSYVKLDWEFSGFDEQNLLEQCSNSNEL